MPKKDVIHEAVKNALIKDAWRITADPYRIDIGDQTLFVDLAVKRYQVAIIVVAVIYLRLREGKIID